MKVKHSGKYRFIVIILVLIGPIRGLNAQLFESFYDQAFFQLDSTNAGDTEKFRIAETVADSLKRLLNEYAFPESPCARIGRVLSDDGLIGVYTFNWQQTDGHHKYCGFVVAKYNKKKPPAVTPLIDNTEKLGLTGILLPSQWYGCLYYRIITQKYRRTISYTMLGWDGNDNRVARKVIEPLVVDSRGNIKLGKNIFVNGKKSVYRAYFQYNAGSAMMLKFDERMNRIVFDHLSPSDPSLTGKFEYYGADFSVDSFKFHKGKWLFEEDIDARNR